MSKQTDKELSVLYLARSEGKIIEARDAVGKWHQAGGGAIHHQDRIRPQTVEEAATCSSANHIYETRSHAYAHENGFKFGVEWRDENPKELNHD